MGGVGAILCERLREQGLERLEFAGVGFAREAERVGELQAGFIGGAAFLEETTGERLAGFDEDRIVEGHEGLERRVGTVAADHAGLAVRGVEGREAGVGRAATRVGVKAAAPAVFAGAGHPVAGAAEGDAQAQVGAHRPDGFAEHLGAEEAAHGERLVAEHLAGGTEARAAGDQTIVGVAFVALRIARGGLAVGAGVQEEREHLLRIPAAGDELAREPVEQLRMDGQVALAAELLARTHDAHAEDRFPETVHRDARGERVVAADDPAGETETILRISIIPARQVRRHAFVDLVAEGLPVAAELHEGLATLVRGKVLHDRHGHGLERLDHAFGGRQLLSLGRRGRGDLTDVVVRQRPLLRFAARRAIDGGGREHGGG